MAAGKNKIVAKLEKILASYERKREQLIPILQNVQAVFGYIPEEVISCVSHHTGVPESQVYGTVSFYAQFRFTPMGKNHIVVCRGTSCHVRGAPQILTEIEKILGIKEGGTTPDLKYSLETVACIGCCGLSPCMVINGKVKTKLTAKKIADILK